MTSKPIVPAGWRVVRLGEVASVDTGGTPSRAAPDYWGGTVPWMSSGEVSQRHVTGTAENITEEGLDNSNAKVFPPGTVMVAMNGQGATRGKTCVLDIHAACNQSLAAIRSGLPSENGFLFHVLDSSYELLRSLTGDGRTGLNLGILRDFKFFLPPLPEQQAIAAVLNAIDGAIERTDAVIAASEQLRDSLLHELLTHGVPGWHSEWKDVLGLGAIPADWDVVRMGDRIEEGPTNGIYKHESEYGRGTCLIRIDDFVPGALVRREGFNRIQVTEEEVHRYGVREGDILINRVNSLSHLGKAVLIPQLREQTLFESNMMMIRMDSSVHPKFAEMVVLSDNARRHFRARAKKAVQQVSINQQDVIELLSPVPGMAEQQAIVGTVDGVDRALMQERQEWETLQTLKASTAHALLTGQVRAVEVSTSV